MNAITTKGSGGPWRLRYCSIDSIQLMLHVEDILNYKLKSLTMEIQPTKHLVYDV